MDLATHLGGHYDKLAEQLVSETLCYALDPTTEQKLLPHIEELYHCH